MTSGYAAWKRNGIALLCLVVFAWCGSAAADVILGSHDWDPGPHGWTNEYGWTEVDRPTTGGNTGGWLRITFTNTTADPGDSWSDLVKTDASGLYAGTWESDMWIAFDFWSGDVSANTLQVRWQSSTNSYVWGYVLTPPGAGSWSSLTASFGNWDDWDVDPGGSEDQYLADLTSIDWIGVLVTRSGTDEQVFGLDNFNLAIPEPEELFLLAAALATTVLSVRRRKRQRLKELPAVSPTRNARSPHG